MEVIFIKDLRGQGKKGDIKDVKTGYAENYLIKNGYAVLKTKDSLRQLEKEYTNDYDDNSIKEIGNLLSKIFIIRSNYNNEPLSAFSSTVVANDLIKDFN